jgi:hypothetical protein
LFDIYVVVPPAFWITELKAAILIWGMVALPIPLNISEITEIGYIHFHYL